MDHNVLLSELNNLDVDPHLARWIAAFLTNRSQRVRIGNSLSPPIGLNGGTPQGTKLAPLLFCILVNGMAAKCKSRVKYVDDATATEIIPRCSPSYLPFTVSDIYTYMYASLTLSLPRVILIDFTLSNARRFYSSMGNPTGVKGLTTAGFTQKLCPH